MTPVLSLFARRRLSGWLAGAVCLSAAALTWIGYRAVIEWEHAAAQVASRRAESAVDLLVSALSRDMRGAAQLILTSAERDGLENAKAVDLLHPIASAFARYPYAEAFFWWRGATGRNNVMFHSRAERHPAWLTSYDEGKSYPVVVGSDPATAARLVDRIGRDAAQGRRLSVFNLQLGGVPYQAVAIISYTDRLRQMPASVLGYLVNLTWARDHYFADMVAQVTRIEGADRGIQFSILDAANSPVVGPARAGAAPMGGRAFPVAFFDPFTVSVDPPADLELPSWTAVATARNDPTLAAAERGARNALGVAAVMALVLTGGLILSLQAGRASARLAEMRSDFVSAVTHELKTPIANLRAIHETLASGRSTIEMSREYSQMGVREAQRLTRLVDNLLAYARITDVADAYSFDEVEIGAIVEQSVREFAPNLQHGGFDVDVDLPEKLPPVRGDVTALNLMLNNLVDNAIRYSKATKHLRIEARAQARFVTVTVSDKGAGIPEDDIPRVMRKFSRGHGSKSGGSGLGLAIVDRIVHDHGGTMTISSRVGEGTSVAITFPVAA